MELSAEVLRRDVVTVGPDEPVLAVARLMRERRVGCVVVEREGRLAGVFTERDLLTKVAPEAADLRSQPVARFMTPDPVTVDAGEPLARVFEILARRRFRHVPITAAGRAVGMVSLSDFAAILPEVFEEEKYLQYFADYVRGRGTP